MVVVIQGYLVIGRRLKLRVRKRGLQLQSLGDKNKSGVAAFARSLCADVGDET